MNKRILVYGPLIIAIVFVLGLFVGIRLSPGYSNQSPILLNISDLGFGKLNQVINYIEQEYVDTVKRTELVDKTIHNLLQDLDPHSYYIPADNLESVTESLEGNFEGIGVEFRIKNDTIMVISPISGGPSDLVGLKAGDRIVKVDDKNVAGVKITNKKVMSLLRGEKGTKVKVSIARKGIKGLQDFSITRDRIPLYSVDASFMIDSQTGYLKLSRFSRTTYQEFMEHAGRLKEKGMQKLVFDLRNNGGGYLDQAIRIADEFLGKGELIVFTEGRSRPRKSYTATSEGDFENIELVVLIDEGTASASEIISGAIQDNDRGIILGRRSYGKGLVQEQSNWPDGSAIRLTIARYYTPSGRSIQTPYDEGSTLYHKEQYDRLGTIQLEIDSSLFPDSLKYYTSTGKIVYGGGGIYPDVFIPYDTLNRTNYLIDLYYDGHVREFALKYVDEHRADLKEHYEDHYAFDQKFEVDQNLFNALVKYASDQGLEVNYRELSISKDLIRNYLKANISRYLFGNDGFYQVLNQDDLVIQKALETTTSEDLN